MRASAAPVPSQPRPPVGPTRLHGSAGGVRRLGLIGVALAVAAGCIPGEPRHEVERLEVGGSTLEENPGLGLSPEQVEGQVRAAIERHPRFRWTPPGTVAAKLPRVHLVLELAFTREARREGRDRNVAEVGAKLQLVRRGQEGASRYEVMGLGEAEVAGADAAARTSAMRAALLLAVAQLLEAAHLQLWAAAKPDKALVADLRSTEGGLREYAVRVLTDRQHPAVAEVLLERLSSDDLDEVRRAMGGLAEAREARAVRPLIELTRGKDASFVAEVLYALGQIGGEEAVAYLFTVAQGHDEPGVRAAAERSLEDLQLRRTLGDPRRSARGEQTR
jgi:hypothetical protein